jgi:hypothetical protein
LLIALIALADMLLMVNAHIQVLFLAFTGVMARTKFTFARNGKVEER